MTEKIFIQKSILQKAKNNLEATCKKAGTNCDSRQITGISQVREILTCLERGIALSQNSTTKLKGLGIATSEASYLNRELLKITYKEIQKNEYFKAFDIFKTDNLIGFFSIAKEYYCLVKRKNFPDLSGKSNQNADPDEIRELAEDIASLEESYNKYFLSLLNPNY